MEFLANLELWNLMHVTYFYWAVLLLHVLLPAYECTGYVCDWSGEPLTYRLNGPLVLAVAVGLPVYLCSTGTLPLSVLTYAAENLWSCVAYANVLGLAGALTLVKAWPLEPSFRCLTVDQAELRSRAAKGEEVSKSIAPAPRRNAAAHFFFGTAFNPRVAGIDIKMALYALGAAGLVWNLVAALALRLSTHGELTTALSVYAAMLLWFTCEYMCLEVIHLYTYDLMCEKLGFKLCWGCLVFYPFFYCVGVWSLVVAPKGADISNEAAAAIGAVFLCGWVLTRGANVQKFLYKTRGARPVSVLGLFEVPMEVVPRTRLLCTGFWGLARHVNYLGEIIQAFALALPGYLVSLDGPLYYRLLPWLYPLYCAPHSLSGPLNLWGTHPPPPSPLPRARLVSPYPNTSSPRPSHLADVALFIPRQMDDDKQMEAKYGSAAFREYARRVPYRIVPGVW
jgi:delta14-sterol reductase